MSYRKISDMTAADSLDGTEVLEVETTDHNSKKVTAQQIADLGGSSGGATVTALSIASGVVDIDWSLGNYFTLDLNENATVTFSNLPTAGAAQSISISITQTGASVMFITLPSSCKAMSGSDTQLASPVGTVTKLFIEALGGDSIQTYVMKGLAA